MYSLAFKKLRIPAIAVSEGLALQLIRYRPRKLVVINNGVDSALFFKDGKTALAAHRSGKYVVTLFSRSDRAKGVDIAIAAISQLSSLRLQKDWELWVIGDPLPSGGPEHRYFGFLKTAESLREFFSAADIHLVPSRNEGLSILLLQAMACGCAVVGTAAVNILKDGEDALISPIENPAALAKNLEIALKDLSLLNRLKQRARQIAEEYSLEKSNILLERTLLSLVEQRIHLQKG